MAKDILGNCLVKYIIRKCMQMQMYAVILGYSNITAPPDPITIL